MGQPIEENVGEPGRFHDEEVDPRVAGRDVRREEYPAHDGDDRHAEERVGDAVVAEDREPLR